MLTRPADFLSRFLYQISEDEFYWVPGTPPTPQIVEKAAARAKDDLGFERHRAHFASLADLIDACTAEELESHGSGQAARNAAKHARVMALAKLDPAARAGVAAAAAQGLAWIEACQPWARDSTLRNQVAIRVMAAVLVVAGRVRKGYEPEQLAGLARIGAGMRWCDLFYIRARGAIIEILAANAAACPRDPATLDALRQLLEVAESHANPAPVIKAMASLRNARLRHA
jgi:hypothetical protein